MSNVKLMLTAPLLAASLYSGHVLSQSHAGHAVQDSRDSRDPTDASVRVPTIAHRSTFSDYRSAREVQGGDWRGANEQVERIGGWRAYANEVEAAREAEKNSGGTATPVPHRHH